MKIQEAIIKKNSLKYKLKNMLESFEFIWDKDNLQNAEKDLNNIIMKAFGILSQENDIETQIAIRNSQIEVEFDGKKMKLIELIKYMEHLNKQISILKDLKNNLSPDKAYFAREQENVDPSILYEKRKLAGLLDRRINSLKDKWRSAQVTLEKTNWTEEF